MADTPYCPLLSIGKDVPVPCQEELCMLYVKQLKLCSITVIGYTNAISMHAPSVSAPAKEQTSQKQAVTKPKTEGKGQTNPFAMDDLE